MRLFHKLFSYFVVMSGIFIGGYGIASTPAPAVTPIDVNVASVSTADIPVLIHSLGNLSAVQAVTLSAESTGRVSQIYFSNGQEVAKDQPILQLDNTETQADYQSAATALKLSRTNYDRSKLLLNQAISQQALEGLKATVESKEADLQNKQALLNKKRLIAPFSGRLGAFHVQAGDYVSVGTPIVDLINTAQVQVNYQLPEKSFPEVKLGQLVKISSAVYPNKIFYGTVNFIAPSVNASTHAFTVQAIIQNEKDDPLLPGLFVQITQEISIDKNALWVPDEAVVADVKGHYVYKVIRNKASQVYIDIGTHHDNKIEVLSGLADKDQVVVAGQQKLEDGALVKVTQS